MHHRTPLGVTAIGPETPGPDPTEEHQKEQ